MSPLHCSTVQEALWERAASPGPAPLSSSLADHLGRCARCRAEGRAVKDLLDISRGIDDPPPPPDVWDDFEAELNERLDASDRGGRRGLRWDRWSRRGLGLAAVLAAGFLLGVLATGDGERAATNPRLAERERALLIADLREELANEARLEAYLDEIEDLLVAYRAAEQGTAVETFRRSLPTTMIAGSGAPSEADRLRLERQRAAREQLRSVVLGMLASEIESDRKGFGYLDRRIAEIVGQQLLYFVQ